MYVHPQSTFDHVWSAFIELSWVSPKLIYDFLLQVSPFNLSGKFKIYLNLLNVYLPDLLPIK